MVMAGDKVQMQQRGISLEAEARQKQRRQMMIALGLLLAALIVVVVKDRDFWFPSSATVVDDTSTDQPTVSETTPEEPTAKSTAPAPRSVKPKPRAQHAAASIERIPVERAPVVAGPTITASNRAALPPLEVEVVAGGQHTVLQPPSKSVKVDLQSGAPALSVPGTVAMPTSPASLANANGATNAGERVRLSPEATQAVEHPVEPSYPMLAKQMKVQGSVILQALIGREGSIQDLRVLSGPAILSTAAMDAVRQWRFRPYYQAGQAIETEARITVNFTISTN